jgi:replicative DNA helicase
MNTNNIENTVIQSLLNNPTYFSQAFPHLELHHFLTIENQEIFKSIQKYYAEYQVAPKAKEIGLSLRDINKENLQKSTIDHFKNIVQDTPITNLKFLIDKTEHFVVDQEYRMAIMVGAKGINDKNDEMIMKSFELMTNALKISFDSNLGLEYDKLERRLEYYKRKVEGYGTGVKSLDEKIIFAPSTLNVIASVSHGGKSLFMSHCASHLLLQGKNILFVTLEMIEEEVAKRVDANIFNLDINTFRTTPDEIFTRAYESVEKHIGKLIIKEYGANSFDTLKLESLYQEVYNERGFYPDIIFIDYLTLMKSTSVPASVGPYTLYKHVSEELHAFAKKYKVPIVTAAQLNRSGYNNMESGLEAVSNSLAIAQTADTFFSLIRNKEMDELGQVLITIQKNRQRGNLDSLIIGVNYPYMRYFDLDGDTTIKNVNPIDLDKVLEGYDGTNNNIFDSFGGMDALGF